MAGGLARGVTLAAVFLETAASRADAHAFGARYDLPVPLGLYLLGAGGAVAVSFVVIALFVRAAAVVPTPRARAFPVLADRSRAGEILAVALFLLVVAAGWFGNQSPLQNLAPAAVWIIWWVGLAYVSALFGNVWALANPWAGLFAWSEALAGRQLSLGWRYPAWLDAWPGVIFLIAFAWIELIFPYSASPFWIASLAALYSLATWAGMAMYGRARWLEHGEAFALSFGVFARLSPFSRERPASNAVAALILFILSSVLFDGLLETPLWGGVAEKLPGNPIFGETFGLLATWLLFVGSYLAICSVMAALAGQERSAGEIARGFAFTLVPIALGYHLAHYLTYLLIQGQYIIPLASDPFGWGWNLFGTAGYRVDISIVGPRFSWYTAVGAIVCGHIVAVLLAHRRALIFFTASRPALRSQYAMTALMVGYTVTSLTILAQPIVDNATKVVEPPPAEVAVPADAILPEPGSGLFRPVGLGHIARAALEFRVLLSPFHDGTEMSAADIVYAYSLAWRWGGGEKADPAIAAATALARRRLVGLKVIGTDAKSNSIRFGNQTVTHPLSVIEVYANVNPSDPDSTAAFAPPWSTVPWTVLALMNEAVTRGWAAFSQGEAEHRGVPWLDLVRDDRLKLRLEALVAEFTHTGYRPQVLKSLVSEQQARDRWTALDAFYRKRGHFLVTDGPYRLKSWSPHGARLEAFRELQYPLGVGSFDNLTIPRRAFITNAVNSAGDLRLSVDVEVLRKFARSYELERQPLPRLASEPTLPGPISLVCRWLVLKTDGTVVLAGMTTPAKDGTIVLPLGGRLRPGAYTVRAAVLVGGNAINLEIARIPYAVPGG